MEVLVCSALMLLMLGYVGAMVQGSKRYLDSAQAKIDLQTSVLTAVTRLGQALVESDHYSILCDQPAGILVFASPRSPQGTVNFDRQGRMLWYRFECYYLGVRNGTSCLLCKSSFLDPPGRQPPGPPLPSTLMNDPTLSETVVARNITRFTPNLQPDGSVVYLVRGDLKLMLHSYGVEMTQDVLAAN